MQTHAAPRVLETTSDDVSQSLPVYDANDLTKGGNLAQIRLDNQIYTLRITRAGKLILTK
ncbi:hemin uptake protein HemP [Albibacillus kandeliae]|uniref:hemin uptake protein HemP n=1 Tax=Albibacillus kandeliae TaxID=2174228 RepID=UPI000D69CD45|nr:hemin uptake protein HemP [Albibacillus kandeliae]